MGCLNTVIVFMLVGLTCSSVPTYRAGIVSSRLGADALAQLIQDAGKANVDILVLPTPEHVKSAQTDNFDEAVKSISKLAKENRVYVVSHLLEKIRCQEKTELIRSNLGFDRRGTVVSVYRKPVDPTASCNITSTKAPTFTTNFGVTFGVLMPEDLVLQNLQGKNYVVAGAWESDIPALAAPQFYSSWAYTTDAILISSSGVYAGKAGKTNQGEDFVVTELMKEGDSTFPITKSQIEDLSQYSIKPLDLSSGEVRETVCHGLFCCQVDVKATATGPQGLTYGLAAFEGIRHFGGQQNIGIQTCALLPCVGDKQCDIGSINNTNIVFDEVSITGNFNLKNSAQFPILLSTDTLSEFQFENKCENNTNQVTIKLQNGENLLNFGIFGRDYSKDYVGKTVNYNNNNGLTYKIYEYINSEEVTDFFDYVWIRLRVLIFVVSIYVLEMM